MADRNPYLILGVDFGASGDAARRAFAYAARRIRRQGGSWSIEDLNWALHEIESSTSRPTDNVSLYRVPADANAFEPAGVGLFQPPAVALARKTAPNDPHARSTVEREAAIELDAFMLRTLGQVLAVDEDPYSLPED